MPTVQDKPTVQTNTESNTAPDFGKGRYSPLMEEVYKDAARIFRLPLEKCEKLARQVGSDVGSIFASAPVKIKTGKINDDGKLTLSEAAKIKGITVTNPIMVLRALEFANEAVKNGFNRNDTKWSVIPKLQEYFDSL